MVVNLNAVKIDFEVTNKCNATCYFCPRDATPHEGLMTIEVFDKSLERAIEYRKFLQGSAKSGVAISLCGLGEPLLNKNAVSFVEKVKQAGFYCSMSSNGAPATEKRAKMLLDAGLDDIFFNVSDIGEEYEKIYNIPFERTCENITRFAELAKDRCDVWIVLVDHRNDSEHLERMEQFWRARGINLFMPFSVINRGGALFVPHQQYEKSKNFDLAKQLLSDGAEAPKCSVPWNYLFVGYDGNHYLCCSDWRKQVNLGSVFDCSFTDVMEKKIAAVTSRNPVCKTCNHDPINRATEELNALEEGVITEQQFDSFVTGMKTALRVSNDQAAEILSKAETVPAR